MSRIGLNIVWFSAMCLVGCSGSGEEVLPTPSDPEKLPILWHVQSPDAVESKALINNNEALQQACNPDVGGESIGIWGVYKAEAYTFLEFDAVPLTYAVKTTGQTLNPSHMWNYPGDNKLWEPGAQYTFRACFPMALMQDIMSEINPDIIQGMVTTTTMQTDLLAASAFVQATVENITKPVQLEMKHLLSGLKFGVRAKSGYTPNNAEKVNSCWLENKDDDGTLFSTSGYLVYSGVVDSETIQWTKSGSSSNKMYYWKHKDGISIPLSSESPASLYVNDSEDTTPGDVYCNNEHWVLVIPQKNDGSLYFGYTLSNAPGLEFRVPIPSITYEPGKLYNYVLEISGADAKITLTIADWNQLDSSFNIVL